MKPGLTKAREDAFYKEPIMQTAQEVESTLNHLIEICRDGQKGFEAAAKAMTDSSLQAELTQYSLQRQRFAADLKLILDSMGESPHEDGSVAGALHRGWINLKAAIAGNNRYAVLAECERGEDSAIKAYREAISSTLSTGLETLVESQYEQVQRVHDRVKELRDAARAK
jgi:uncharacterized protein (TIGR02284 family)